MAGPSQGSAWLCQSDLAGDPEVPKHPQDPQGGQEGPEGWSPLRKLPRGRTSGLWVNPSLAPRPPQASALRLSLDTPCPGLALHAVCSSTCWRCRGDGTRPGVLGTEAEAERRRPGEGRMSSRCFEPPGVSSSATPPGCSRTSLRPLLDLMGRDKDRIPVNPSSFLGSPLSLSHWEKGPKESPGVQAGPRPARQPGRLGQVTCPYLA